jgi:hypothetical protein
MRPTPALLRWVTFALAALASPVVAGIAPTDLVEPLPDSAYAPRVSACTTDPMFVSPLVAGLPDHPDIPSPREFLGYVVGEPGRLTYYSDIRAYFESLAQRSSRVAVEVMGKSNEGREMIVVFVADEGVISALAKYADYTSSLSDPRVTGEGRAREIVDEALPFYYFCGGLHSNETGSPEMLMELAYRLAVGESPLVRRIRKNVITMITPVLETDGRERMVDWYYNVTVDHEDWDDMPPRHPPYWGRYTLHDNNRDGLQLTQPLSRSFAATFFEYHPQVVHDLHESLPLLYVSSGTGPYNEALDPIVTAEWQWISNHEVAELTKLGLPGVWTWGFYTGWWPGYLIWVANNHNSIGRFYETFGNSGASTFQRELKAKFAGQEVTTRQWYRPWPPEKSVEWSFRNTINYMESGALVALDFCARNGGALLYNYWKKGTNAVERGRSKAPYAFVIRRGPRLGYEVTRLIETLMDQRIEVHTLDENVRIDRTDFAEGDFLVRMDQPYGRFARSLLEPQRFPDDADHPPYDDVAWTLPLLYGVDVERVDNDAVLGARVTAIEVPPRPVARASSKRSDYYVVPASSSCTLLAARYALSGADVWAADSSFEAGGRSYPRGSWIVAAGEDVGALNRLSSELGLDVDALPAEPDVARHDLDIPRIAVFHTWLYTQDSGWARYTFDRWSIPYTLINKDDVRDGNLRAYYDVILIPDTGHWLPPKRVIHGIGDDWSPIPYPVGGASSQGEAIDRSEDITGGIGFAGLVEIEEFVESGGTLITLGSASLLPTDLGLAPHVNRVRPSGFHNPGSVIRTLIVDPKNPLAAGYDDTTSVFRGNTALLEVEEHFRDRYTVMQYGTQGPNQESNDDARPICLSGMVSGGRHLEGKPAILAVPRGEGRIVMFTFNPLHRFLNLSDFGLAFNAILHWND